MNNIKDFENLNQKNCFIKIRSECSIKKGMITDETRIDKILPTIQFLLKKILKL